MSYKEQLFSHFRKSLIFAGIESVNKNALICPLCWKEKKYEDLTLEHIVPKSVGGTKCVLTCKACNNTHGSSLDSHLSKFQSTQDAFKGHGTLRGKIKRNENSIAANIEWGNNYKNIQIIDKASSPHAIKNLQNEYESHALTEIDIVMQLGYSKLRFQTAMLRCAYLALFKIFGYEYAQHQIVQIIRKKINHPENNAPRLKTLIGKINCKETLPNNSYAIVPGNTDGVEFFLVILALKKQTQTIHSVFMPAPIGAGQKFFATMEELSKHLKGEKIHVPTKHMFN